MNWIWCNFFYNSLNSGYIRLQPVLNFFFLWILAFSSYNSISVMINTKCPVVIAWSLWKFSDELFADVLFFESSSSSFLCVQGATARSCRKRFSSSRSLWWTRWEGVLTLKPIRLCWEALRTSWQRLGGVADCYL